MKIRHILLLLVFVLVTSCRPAPVESTQTPTAPPAAELPTPLVNSTHVPEVKDTATRFLDAWKAGSFEEMYSMLTNVTKESISQEDFTARYKDAAINLTMTSVEYEVLSSLTNPTQAQVAYRLIFQTALVGEISRDTLMNLSLENGQWQIMWEDGMILPDLRGGNRLVMDIKVPARANIYDREGVALVAQSDAVALGLVPDQIEDGREGRLVEELARLTGKSTGEVEAIYEYARDTNWYVAIGEAPLQDVQARYDVLSSMGGMVMNNFTSRYYFEGGLAAHVTGYVQPIYAEELERYRQLGYRGDEKVGQQGLEKWGEDWLSGKHGASLYVTDPQGQIVTRISQTDPQPASAIYTTIDADLQRGVEKSIAGFNGAAIVMERDTGRILAMASYPDFNPNLFEPTNYNSGYQLGELMSAEDRPLLNRATQGGYPLGSVFKIITMATALESGLYTPESIYECGYEFTELPGQTFYDWTYEKEVAASGTLNLVEGLMRSCNPWFYHIGLDLYRQNRPTDLANMARSFGLGEATGIEQLAEDAGQIVDPANEGAAMQMGIGQGDMLVTPLQVVDFIAAVGNGGTLYRPQVVEKVVTSNGETTYSFAPEERGTLPIKPETLAAIREGMRMVVSDKRGTAYRTFSGITVNIYGKTGTATTSLSGVGAGKPHAWFAGYTDSPREDLPNIAIVVIAEEAGEGSEIAAPIFRRIIEYYYEGKPGRLYPWESTYFVTETTTPEVTDTPVIPPTETPSPEQTAPESDATATPIGQQ